MGIRTLSADVQVAATLAAQYMETYEQEKKYTPTEFAQRFLEVEKEIFAVLNPVHSQL